MNADGEKVLSKQELKGLKRRAEVMYPDKWYRLESLYRNKDEEYWEVVTAVGRIPVAEKDLGGHAGSPINGRLKGVFFCARPSDWPPPGPWSPALPTISPFGDVRFVLPAATILHRLNHLYFADFYCLLPGQPHYATLVLCRPHSPADDFCRKHLPRLPWDNNNFFRFDNEGKLEVQMKKTYIRDDKLPEKERQLWVEVFYTEEVELSEGEVLEERSRLVGKGSSKAGGVPSTAGCQICSLQCGLTLPDSPATSHSASASPDP